MNAVILQPCGNKDSRAHYDDTILNPVDLDLIQQYVTPDEYNVLKQIYPDSRVRVWGVTPGKSKQNISKWNRISAGDVTLLSAKNRIFSSAIATFKTHNRALAERLWGTNKDGETWEYIYFVAEVFEQNIPYKEFNKVVGYKSNFIIQGFTVLDEEKSQFLLNYFDLESTTFKSPVKREEAVSEIENKFVDQSSLDTQVNSLGRKEQGYLRDILFKNKVTSECCICGQEYPVSFLVAAHIKKRSDCTLDEKKDFDNIVAPMCVLGCDSIYEKGLIGVENGRVVRIPNKKKTTFSLDTYIQKVIGNECGFWNRKTETYFSFHISKYLKKQLDN